MAKAVSAVKEQSDIRVHCKPLDLAMAFVKGPAPQKQWQAAGKKKQLKGAAGHNVAEPRNQNGGEDLVPNPPGGSSASCSRAQGRVNSGELSSWDDRVSSGKWSDQKCLKGKWSKWASHIESPSGRIRFRKNQLSFIKDLATFKFIVPSSEDESESVLSSWLYTS